MTASRSVYRTRIAASSLVVGPLLMSIGDLMHPAERSDAADQIAILMDGATRWYAAHLLLFIGSLLFIPGVLAVTGLAAERRPAVGYAARLLMLVASSAFAAVFVFEMLLARVVIDDAVAATALLKTFESGKVLGSIAPALLAFFVGIGLVVFALVPAPAPFRWPAVGFGLGAIFIFVEIVSYEVVFSQIGNVLVFLAATAFAWLIVRRESSRDGTERSSQPVT